MPKDKIDQSKSIVPFVYLQIFQTDHQDIEREDTDFVTSQFSWQVALQYSKWWHSSMEWIKITEYLKHTL